jgi:hypothetical protein
VRGVLGCNQQTRLVADKILSVWIFLQCDAYLIGRYHWFCFRLWCLCSTKSCLVFDKILSVWIFLLLFSYRITLYCSFCWCSVMRLGNNFFCFEVD